MFTGHGLKWGFDVVGVFGGGLHKFNSKGVCKLFCFIIALKKDFRFKWEKNNGKSIIFEKSRSKIIFFDYKNQK